MNCLAKLSLSIVIKQSIKQYQKKNDVQCVFLKLFWTNVSNII